MRRPGSLATTASQAAACHVTAAVGKLTVNVDEARQAGRQSRMTKRVWWGRKEGGEDKKEEGEEREDDDITTALNLDEKRR